jgi:hypothetical protein
MSASLGCGVAVTAAGASVVPAIVSPCHGSMKTTRPSRVLGTIMPSPSGE